MIPFTRPHLDAYVQEFMLILLLATILLEMTFGWAKLHVTLKGKQELYCMYERRPEFLGRSLKRRFCAGMHMGLFVLLVLWIRSYLVVHHQLRLCASAHLYLLYLFA